MVSKYGWPGTFWSVASAFTETLGTQVRHSYILLLSTYLSGLVGSLAVSSLVIHVPSKGDCANRSPDASSSSPKASLFMRHLSDFLAAQRRKVRPESQLPEGCAGRRLDGEIVARRDDRVHPSFSSYSWREGSYVSAYGPKIRRATIKEGHGIHRAP